MGCDFCNRIIFHDILKSAVPISVSIDYWRLRSNQPYWFLYEKTPLYWIDCVYHATKTSKIIYPNFELQSKLEHLTALENTSLSHLGQGTNLLF